MELALYFPGLGYYTSGNQKFGASGDFITAPELSPLFSKCLARSCQATLKSLNGSGNILEIGAGSGQMAIDVLTELATLDTLPDRYFILEISAELRERQQANLKQHCPLWFSKIHWLDTLPNIGFKGIILANEVCDAMPVRRFCIQSTGIHEGYVNEQQGQLIWQWLPAQPSFIAQIEARFKTIAGLDDSTLPFIDQLRETSSGSYFSEINLNIKPWVKSLSTLLETGTIIVIDYGFPRHEYYHPSRDQGTLQCHYRHHAHQNPFFYPGLQDITAHVDFTEIAEAACDNGLCVFGFTNQASFLIENGILEIAQENHVDGLEGRHFFQQNRDIQLLTSPNSMGELFKVMGLSKGTRCTMPGFSFTDLRYRL